MININYQKRKNIELFKTLEGSSTFLLSKTQNYIPIYTKFFNLNETNYNNINLNNKWYLSDVNCNLEDDNLQKGNICKIKNMENNKTKHANVFFKMAPLLDPFKYLIGKYNINDTKLFNLPKINSDINHCNPKIIDANNAAYVDGFFIFLTNQLLHYHNFTHGLEYYGSFLAIKKDYTINVFDDIDYLNTSDFFNKNKNLLFTIDDYEHLFESDKPKLMPIKIGNDISCKSRLSIKSLDNELFENIFEENDKNSNFYELKDISFNLTEIDNINKSKDDNINNKEFTLKSSSSCSSRTSYTNDENVSEKSDLEDNENVDEYTDKSDNNSNNQDDNSEWETEDEEDDELLEEEEEILNVVIPQFPIQLIAMEKCETTFDELIINNELNKDEWFSAFIQIVMMLITYQKCFNFTHNDLHSNNIMYNTTTHKYIYYCYKKKYYKVPTYGRIFKIIDFGRSIYKFDGKTFCSDSFQLGGDASTQYNTEPYFNDKKPRLEPNYSFDLCRLACSIFDYVIDDFEEIKDVSKIKDPVKKIILEWCLDDKGINVLYKNDGSERYPDFKLYKMIARYVHNHTPQAQLKRAEFDKFTINNLDIKENDYFINIDSMPSYV